MIMNLLRIIDTAESCSGAWAVKERHKRRLSRVENVVIDSSRRRYHRLKGQLSFENFKYLEKLGEHYDHHHGYRPNSPQASILVWLE